MTPQEKYDKASRDERNEMFPFLPVLLRKAAGVILEIGTCDGYSTAAFLLGVKARGGYVYSVDIDPRCSQLYPGNSQWSFIHSDSVVASNVIKALPKNDACIDVLLIDGYHEHPIVDSDVQNYVPLVKKGGVVLMHDINMHDVRDAYHELCVRTGFVHFELQDRWGLGIVYVR